MIKGIGTDILKIIRMREILECGANPFVEKVYTSKEKEQAEMRCDPVLYYATHFAGKEAVIKCFGDVAGEVCFNEIEITDTDIGKPEVILLGKTRDLGESIGINSILVSLSYDDEYAQAFAIALYKA